MLYQKNIEEMRNPDELNEMIREMIGVGFFGFLAGLFTIVIFCLIQIIPIYLLWNWLMPAIFNLPDITFLQSCGIYLLSCLLIKPHSWLPNKN